MSADGGLRSPETLFFRFDFESAEHCTAGVTGCRLRQKWVFATGKS
jgi:hypothetical protein